MLGFPGLQDSQQAVPQVQIPKPRGSGTFGYVGGLADSQRISNQFAL